MGICLLAAASPLAAAEPSERGIVAYRPAEPDAAAPPFRLTAHEFPFERTIVPDVSPRFELSRLTFPSPMTTPVPENNTVHCEYFRPVGPGKRPAVIMLHILGGDFELSRLFCNALAHHGVAALFVKLPYYGPRRGQGTRRMVSNNPEETVAGFTQAVLDIRRAAAWLATRDEVDADQVGICGISLGGITGALAFASEPRLTRACLLLAGGDASLIRWDAPEVARYRQRLTEAGYTKEDLLEMVRPIDPVTHGRLVNGRQVLLLNARDDEVIPRAHTEALWKAFGKPEIVWYPGGHYTVGFSMPNALVRTVRFFDGKRPAE